MPKQWVVTGWLARDLKAQPTYVPRYGEELTPDQEIEMTRPYAELMATQLKGRPYLIEHDYQAGPIGQILHSWVDDSGWSMMAVVDDSSERGREYIQACQEGLMSELSLGHNDNEKGISAVEASGVQRGAREGCHVREIRQMEPQEVDEIKRRVYRPGPSGAAASLRLPSDFQPPAICCSFDRAHRRRHTNTAMTDTPPTTLGQPIQTSRTMLRQPAPHAYIESDLTSDTTQLLRMLLNQGSRQPQQTQQLQQQQQQPKQQQAEQETAMSIDDLSEDQLAELMARKKASRTAKLQAKTGDNEMTTDQLKAELLRRMGGAAPTHVVSQTDADYTGNAHTTYTNPQDQMDMAENKRNTSLLDLMGLVNNKKNFFTSEQIENGRSAITNLAMEQAQLSTQLQQLEAENSRLRSLASAPKASKAAAPPAAGPGGAPITRENLVSAIRTLLESDQAGGGAQATADITCSKVGLDERMARKRTSTQYEDDDREHPGSATSLRQLMQISKSGAMGMQPRSNGGHAYDGGQDGELTPARFLASAKGTSVSAMDYNQAVNNRAGTRVDSTKQNTWLLSGIHPSLEKLFTETDRGLSTAEVCSQAAPGRSVNQMLERAREAQSSWLS